MWQSTEGAQNTTGIRHPCQSAIPFKLYLTLCLTDCHLWNVIWSNSTVAQHIWIDASSVACCMGHQLITTRKRPENMKQTGENGPVPSFFFYTTEKSKRAHCHRFGLRLIRGCDKHLTRSKFPFSVFSDQLSFLNPFPGQMCSAPEHL